MKNLNFIKWRSQLYLLKNIKVSSITDEKSQLHQMEISTLSIKNIKFSSITEEKSQLHQMEISFQ